MEIKHCQLVYEMLELVASDNLLNHRTGSSITLLSISFTPLPSLTNNSLS